MKGRDWYDLEWYIRNRVQLNLAHFNRRAIQSEHLSSPVDGQGLLDGLQAHIETTDFEQAKHDVARFLRDPSTLEIWSRTYFQQLRERMLIN